MTNIDYICYIFSQPKKKTWALSRHLGCGLSPRELCSVATLRFPSVLFFPFCLLFLYLPWAYIYLAQIFPVNPKMPSGLSQLYIKTYSKKKTLMSAIPSLSFSAQPYQIRGALYLIYLCCGSHDSVNLILWRVQVTVHQHGWVLLPLPHCGVDRLWGIFWLLCGYNQLAPDKTKHSSESDFCKLWVCCLFSEWLGLAARGMRWRWLLWCVSLKKILKV